MRKPTHSSTDTIDTASWIALRRSILRQVGAVQASLQRLEKGFAAAFSNVSRAIDGLFSVDDKVVLQHSTSDTP